MLTLFVCFAIITTSKRHNPLDDKMLKFTKIESGRYTATFNNGVVCFIENTDGEWVFTANHDDNETSFYNLKKDAVAYANHCNDNNLIEK